LTPHSKHTASPLQRQVVNDAQRNNHSFVVRILLTYKHTIWVSLQSFVLLKEVVYATSSMILHG